MSFFVLFLISLLDLTYADEKEVCFNVEGMTCSACKLTTKVALKKIKGVMNVEVSVEKRWVRVRFDDSQTKIIHLKKGIDEIGYKVSDQECTL